MAGFTYSTLTTAIGSYTEVGTSVLTSTITDQFIDNAELRVFQVYTSTSVATGANSFLLKKDISYLREYDAAQTTTGTPKYYAMSGGAEGTGATSSGRITVVPTPSSAFMY